MTDYSELVRKMRTCIGDKKCFKKECRYWSELGCMDGNICCDAAAAIEELQAELEKKRTADCWGCKCEKLEPKRGEWINHKDEHQCSVCRETVVVDEIRWEQIGAYDCCPNCGAKMEVQE